MPRGDRLFDLLDACSEDELAAVWKVDLRKKLKTKEFEHAGLAERHLLISAELRAAAGHSVSNVRRGPHDLEWGEVLRVVVRGLAADSGEKGAELFRKLRGRDPEVETDERAVLKLADARVQHVLSKQKAKAPEHPVLPGEIEDRIQIEDKAIRSIFPFEVALDGLDQPADDGVIGKAARVLLSVSSKGIDPVRHAMRPAYRKVVPAVVRLVQIGSANSLLSDA